MEVKAWSYEEMPEFLEEVEGAEVILTTGEEAGVRYIHNVEYANVDGTPLHLQILIPDSRNDKTSAKPCLVHVQGSAWFQQDVYQNLANVARLALRGYVVAIVEYRHSGIASFPAQIMDARNAIRFMRVHAEEYRVDPKRMFVSGDSSGGHTAMFAGILHDDEENNLFHGVTADVNGIINFYGSTSFINNDSNPSEILHCKADSPEGMVMGHIDFDDKPEIKQKLSVECNIFEDTVVPPTLILHGTKDRIVNCECSVILYRRLKECGKQAKLYLIKGADHGGSEFWSEEVLQILDSFMGTGLCPTKE